MKRNSDYEIRYTRNKRLCKSSCVRRRRRSIMKPKLNKSTKYRQLYLDIGQKSFSLKQCKICGMSYTPGLEADEALHQKYHRNQINGILIKNLNKRYKEVFNEKIYSIDGLSFKNSKQFEDVDNLLKNEFTESISEIINENVKVFVYISSNHIIGLTCIENTNNIKKFTIIKNTKQDKAINLTYPKCGIKLIWILKSKRRQGIATSLLNALRINYVYGYKIRTEEIAFREMTEEGLNLAMSYCSHDIMTYKN